MIVDLTDLVIEKNNFKNSNNNTNNKNTLISCSDSRNPNSNRCRHNNIDSHPILKNFNTFNFNNYNNFNIINTGEKTNESFSTNKSGLYLGKKRLFKTDSNNINNSSFINSLKNSNAEDLNNKNQNNFIPSNNNNRFSTHRSNEQNNDILSDNANDSSKCILNSSESRQGEFSNVRNNCMDLNNKIFEPLWDIQTNEVFNTNRVSDQEFGRENKKMVQLIQKFSSSLYENLLDINQFNNVYLNKHNELCQYSDILNIINPKVLNANMELFNNFSRNIVIFLDIFSAFENYMNKLNKIFKVCQSGNLY